SVSLVLSAYPESHRVTIHLAVVDLCGRIRQPFHCARHGSASSRQMKSQRHAGALKIEGTLPCPSHVRSLSVRQYGQEGKQSQKTQCVPHADTPPKRQSLSHPHFADHPQRRLFLTTVLCSLSTALFVPPVTGR